MNFPYIRKKVERLFLFQIDYHFGKSLFSFHFFLNSSLLPSFLPPLPFFRTSTLLSVGLLLLSLWWGSISRWECMVEKAPHLMLTGKERDWKETGIPQSLHAPGDLTPQFRPHLLKVPLLSKLRTKSLRHGTLMGGIPDLNYSREISIKIIAMEHP